MQPDWDQNRRVTDIESNLHVRICKMYGIVAQWVQYKSVLCVDEACDENGDEMVKISRQASVER